MAAIPLGDVLARYWPVALVSLLVSLAATPLCRKFALKRGIVDKPDAYLKPHEKPVAYLGGVAVFLGWIAGIGVALTLEDISVRRGLMGAIALAGLGIMLIGLFDDLRVMQPKVKLLLNLVVAGWLIYMGLGDKLVQTVVGFMKVDLSGTDRWLELAYSVPAALLIIVGACNATNLIDGLDGLCAGVLGIISIGFFIIAAHLRTYTELEVADERIILALAMLGGALGFLPFNFNPARIFLGDAGSMLLGLNAAVLILLFAEANMVRWMLGALMVFGLPLSDMLLAMVRRWRNGRPIMLGDRSHFYDQLRDRGLSVRQVVFISYGLTLLFVFMGVLSVFVRTRYSILLYTAFVVGICAAIARFNMVSIERERPAGDKGGPVEPQSHHPGQHPPARPQDVK